MIHALGCQDNFDLLVGIDWNLKYETTLFGLLAYYLRELAKLRPVENICLESVFWERPN